jgi:hypothetical protein
MCKHAKRCRDSRLREARQISQFGVKQSGSRAPIPRQ